jgi:LMBR1 domain-containing protein 1
MVLFWNIFYWTIPIFVFILIPFLTFFYEADDGTLMAGTSIGAKPNSRLREALCYESVVVVVFGTIFAVGYLLAGESAVPVKTYPVLFSERGTFTVERGNETEGFRLSELANMTDTDVDSAVYASNNSIWRELNFNVTIPTFFAGIMAFIGWFFFAIFGGIGVSAVPLDLMNSFLNRPKVLSPSEFADAQLSIRQKTNELVDIGELLKIDRDEKNKLGTGRGVFGGFSKEARSDRAAFLEFKKAVFLLEQDVEEFMAASVNYKNYNPLLPWLWLFLGFITFIISGVWIAHVVLFLSFPKPVYPFLNNYLRWFDSWFPLFGVLTLAVFSVYLLFCAVKGCFKFGLRFLAFQIHPMQLNKTYMSSFMFNVGLILLCSLPVVQFCVTAFSDYSRYTNVAQVMGVQVYYLKFFRFFWEEKVFIYAFLSFAGVAALYLMLKPKESAAVKKKKGMLARLKRR